jgi:succinate dehydrogenase / fumarate reductase membrane anchor subunit
MVIFELWRQKGGYFNWYLQRVTTVFTVVFVAMLLWHAKVHHAHTVVQWHVFMHRPYPFILSGLAMVSMIIHAYIGLWTVLTDYVRHRVFQKGLHLLLAAGVLSLLMVVMQVMKEANL